MNHSIYLRLSAFGVSTLLLGMVMTGCGGSNKSEEDSSYEIADTTQMSDVTIDTDIFGAEARISGLKYNKATYNKETDTYTFEAKAVLADITSKPKLKYTLEYSLDEKDVLTSDNGKFEGVKPLKAGTYYILKVECEGLESAQTEIPAEEMPVIPKITKSSVKEINTKLNDSSAPLLTNSEILTPDCVFEFQNKQEPYEITSILKIYEKIEYEDWVGVEVISLGYDEFNRVNKIIMKINYPQD